MTIEHARDIPDVDFLRAVAFFRRAKGRWANRFEVAEALGNPPEKVVIAKARRLILRKLMTGCACGCRGDFELTPLGAERVSGEEPR